MTNLFIKDPQAVLDYQWDWSAWLTTGETISTATVTAPSGLTVHSSGNTTTSVTAWLTGGTEGMDYQVICHIATNQGRQDDRSIKIQVRER